MQAESYIVRIYRRGSAGSGVLVGVVETPGAGWQKAFQDIAQLGQILAAPGTGVPRSSDGLARNEDPTAM